MDYYLFSCEDEKSFILMIDRLPHTLAHQYEIQMTARNHAKTANAAYLRARTLAGPPLS